MSADPHNVDRDLMLRLLHSPGAAAERMPDSVVVQPDEDPCADTLNWANGNAVGGGRPPQVDAPIATLTGQSSGSPGFCFLFGTTVTFSATQLTRLSMSHSQFVSAWARAIRRDRQDGFLLRADAVELLHSAAVSQIGRRHR